MACWFLLRIWISCHYIQGLHPSLDSLDIDSLVSANSHNAEILHDTRSWLHQELMKWLLLKQVTLTLQVTSIKQVLFLPGFSRRATCRTLQCHPVTVDWYNINTTPILIFTGTAVVQRVIRWWRKVMVGRRHFLDPGPHFWCRCDRTRRGRAGRRSFLTLRATAFTAAGNQ
jgi:hypothetical protein